MGDVGQGGSQKEEVRRGGQNEEVRRGGGQRRGSWVMVIKEEVRGRRPGRTHKEAPPLQLGFPWQGDFRPGKQPQGAGAGECREGDSLALGLRPGSFDSSQN